MQNEELSLARAEAEAAHARYSELYDFAPVGYLTLGLDGAILDANRASAPLLGEDQSALIGRRFDAFICEPDLPNYEDFWQRVLGRGERPVCEARVPRDVSWPRTIRMEAVMASSGREVRLVATDVTARKLAEEEVWKLSRAVEQSPVSIVITDPAGLIEYVNQRFTHLTGYELSEVVGRNPRLLKGDRTPPEEYTRLWTTIVGGGEWRGMFHNRRKNGDFYWERAFISPIFDQNRRISHFLALKEDITERLRMEEELRHSQKMDAMGRLAGGVAHDFNNLLAAIMLQLGLLQTDQDIPARARESLAELGLEAKRGAELVRQLLLFSRRKSPVTKLLDLNALMEQMLKMLRRLLGETVHIVFDPCPDLPSVDADPGMLEQLVMNICVNARDAMPDGGDLYIACSRFQAQPQPETAPHAQARAQAQVVAAPSDASIPRGEFVRLSFADTGCGMDAVTLGRIYEPFFTTKDVGKGTGLGLATVYGIVQQHKGWIEVSSTPGVGTEFRVFLPACALPAHPEKAPRAGSCPRGHGETILLVEDEPSVRKITAQAMQSLGYVVIEAENGAEALKLWREHRVTVDVVFTDMVMPGGISGATLLQRLRSDRPDVGAVLASGYSLDLDQHRKPLGDDVLLLAKPFELGALAQTLQKALAYRRAD